MSEQPFVDDKALSELNDKVYERGMVDRAHILEFLTLVNTSDAPKIVEAVKKWLEDLHNDPKFSKIQFPKGDITAILGDLDSYGRVQAETIMQFKQESNKTLPIS